MNDKNCNKRLGAALTWQNIVYDIKGKRVLKNIHGEVEPCKFLAIMGPSGSGKTTLLNILSGRKCATSGAVKIGTKTMSRSLRRTVAYVLQHDILLPNLTVRQTLHYTAELMVPASVSTEDKRRRIDELTQSLGLTKVLDCIIGDEDTRGLSGGEKKRVNIACELLNDTDVLILDEPTTGLDSSTAFDLINLLKKYSISHEKPVVATIHQPSSMLFYLFDSILILADGQMVYNGSPRTMVDFCVEAGLQDDEHANPADYILEKIRESDDVVKKLTQATNIQIEKRGPGNSGNPGISTALTKHSPPHSQRSQLEGEENVTFGEGRAIVGWQTSWCRQFITLTKRNFANARRTILDPSEVTFTIMMMTTACLLWFQLPRTEHTVHDRKGLIFHMSHMMSAQTYYGAIASFPKDIVVVNKERMSGLYHLSAYYCAKMISELPYIIIEPVVYGSVVFWVTNMAGIHSFFQSILVLILLAVTSQGLGIMLSVMFINNPGVRSASICVFMAFLLLSGFYREEVPVWVGWCKYMNYLTHGYQAILELDFYHKPIPCSRSNSSDYVTPFATCMRNGSHVPVEEITEYLNVHTSAYLSIFLVVVFLIAYRLIGYLFLRFVHKPNRRS